MWRREFDSRRVHINKDEFDCVLPKLKFLFEQRRILPWFAKDDLVKKADIKYTTLMKVERGAVNKLSVQTMAKITIALVVSIKDLL